MSTKENNAAKLGESLSVKSAIFKNSQDGDAVSFRSNNSIRQMSHDGSLSSCCSNSSADDGPTDEDVYLGAKNYMPASELGESILLAPDITMFCQKCQRYIDISDLKEHGSYHEALQTFQYKDLAPANLGSLTSRRKTLIKEMFGKLGSCNGCLDPASLKKLDDAYEIIRAELESNARRVFGVNSHEVCGLSVKCDTMPCIKAIGSCCSLNKRWKNVMDEERTFQNCFGGDPTKCFLGIYSGYNGPNAAETSAREFHKCFQSEIEKFEKCLHSENQLEEAVVNVLDENEKGVGQDFSYLQGKQDIHDITKPQSFHSSLSSDGSKVISENLKAIPDEVKHMKTSVKEDGTSLLWNKHKDSPTYARKVSDAFVTAHLLVDEMLSYGKGETSRVRWSGCSTLTCLIQNHEDNAAREEALRQDDCDATKESESNQRTPNGDRQSVMETLDTSGHQRESQQMHFHQRTHLATIHLANAGDARAVLVRRNKPTCLSIIHTPANEKEHQRITKLGGTVNHSHKGFRLNGVLATTRGLGNHGDRLLKKCVIKQPFTASISVDKFCQFLILASNGVWQVLSEEEAAVLLLEMLPCQNIPPPSIISTTVDDLLRGGNKKNAYSLIADFEEDNSTIFDSLHSQLNYTSKSPSKKADMHCLDKDLNNFSDRDSSLSGGNSIAIRNNTLDKASTAHEGQVIENSDRISAAEHPQDSSSPVLEGLQQKVSSVSTSLDKPGSNGNMTVISENPTQMAEMITAEDEPLRLSRLMAERLVQAALMAGTKDNVTVMIVLFNDSIDLS